MGEGASSFSIRAQEAYLGSKVIRGSNSETPASEFKKGSCCRTLSAVMAVACFCLLWSGRSFAR